MEWILFRISRVSSSHRLLWSHWARTVQSNGPQSRIENESSSKVYQGATLSLFNDDMVSRCADLSLLDLQRLSETDHQAASSMVRHQATSFNFVFFFFWTLVVGLLRELALTVMKKGLTTKHSSEMPSRTLLQSSENLWRLRRHVFSLS